MQHWSGLVEFQSPATFQSQTSRDCSANLQADSFSLGADFAAKKTLKVGSQLPTDCCSGPHSLCQTRQGWASSALRQNSWSLWASHTGLTSPLAASRPCSESRKSRPRFACRACAFLLRLSASHPSETRVVRSLGNSSWPLLSATQVTLKTSLEVDPHSKQPVDWSRRPLKRKSQRRRSRLDCSLFSSSFCQKL